MISTISISNVSNILAIATVLMNFTILNISFVVAQSTIQNYTDIPTENTNVSYYLANSTSNSSSYQNITNPTTTISNFNVAYQNETQVSLTQGFTASNNFYNTTPIQNISLTPLTIANFYNTTQIQNISLTPLTIPSTLQNNVTLLENNSFPIETEIITTNKQTTTTQSYQLATQLATTTAIPVTNSSPSKPTFNISTLPFYSLLNFSNLTNFSTTTIMSTTRMIPASSTTITSYFISAVIVLTTIIL